MHVAEARTLGSIEKIRTFRPGCEQEERDRAVMLDWIERQPDAFERGNLVAHMTASAWTVNPDHSRALMVYHNIYNSWSWMGGHADGDRDLLAVALREVREESGLLRVAPVSEDIFSLEILTVDGHVKRGKYVPSHLHMNVTFLLEAEETQVLAVKPDENSGVRWFGLEEAVAASSEAWFRKWVYPKLNGRLRALPCH